MKLYQKIIFLLSLCTVLFGCATSSYETYWLPFQDNGITLSTALSKCSVEASQAAREASRNASSSAPSGGGFAGGLASSISNNLAGPLARNSAMNSCMMTYGFRKEQRCISNC